MNAIPAVLGGIGLFLIGMWMMTEGLKQAAGRSLQHMLASVTQSRWRGLLAGAAITALVQSSSAVIVAVIGFVNAGLLTLGQSVWVLFGANVGTTMTGWLVALIGVKVDIGRLALPLLGAGMLLRLLASGRPRLAGLGEALAGFGAFFLGIGFLSQGFTAITLTPDQFELGLPAWLAPAVFVIAGAGLAILTQSSSAAIAIILTANAGDVFSIEQAAAAVIGTNIGTTSTAAFAALGATSPAKRVAAAHIAFNLLTGVAALALLPWLAAASRWLAVVFGGHADTTVTLALFHTVFNCLGIVLIWPLADRLIGWLAGHFVGRAEELGRPHYLDVTLTGVPDLALRALALESSRMAALAHDLARARIASPDAPHLREDEDGLMRLGQSVRAFISDLSRHPLPEDVTVAIPDIIRGIQHLEEVAVLARNSAHPPGGDIGGAAESVLAALRSLTLEGLETLRLDTHEPGDAPDPLAVRIEARYQSVKTALLADAAQGRIPVAAMEDALYVARHLRRCAEAAHKANIRLARWRARAASLDKASYPG